MRVIQSTTIIEKGKQNTLKFYNVYKKIKEVGELTLGDLTVMPSSPPRCCKQSLPFLFKESKKSCSLLHSRFLSRHATFLPTVARSDA